MLAAAARPCGQRFIVTHGGGRASPVGPRVALQPRPSGRAHGSCAPGWVRAGEGRLAVRDRALQRGRPVPSTPSPGRSPWGPLGRPQNSCLKPREALGMRVARGGAQQCAAQRPCFSESAGLQREQAPAPLAPGKGTVLSRVRLASPASRLVVWLVGFHGEAMFTAQNLTGCTWCWEIHIRQT